MSFAGSNLAKPTWPEAERKFVELDRDGRYLLNPVQHRSKSYNASGAIDITYSHHVVDNSGGAVVLTFPATAAAMKNCIAREYRFMAISGANAMTINTPSGAIIYTPGNAAPQANVTRTGTEPHTCTVYVSAADRVHVVAATDMA